jgi:LacI family transcriptional regulator
LAVCVVTIRDVAAAANVSVGTVSKVLRGTGSLRHDTSERVRAAAVRLGYQANPSAASLRTGRTFTVGLLTLDGYGRFTPEVIGGIEDALTAELCSTILCDARGDAVRQRRYLDALVHRRIDGLIVTGRVTDPYPAFTEPLPFPIVYAYATSANPGVLTVTVDDVDGGRLGTEALVRAGRRRLAHVTGPVHYRAVGDRLAGARRLLDGYGLDLPDERVLPGPWGEEWGRASADRILAGAAGTDGVLCGSDLIARGLLDRLRERSVRVPDDIAVVGYDNWTLVADGARPSLTSVDMNLYDVGHRAARLLLNQAGTGQPGDKSIALHCALTVRDSCPVTDWDPPSPAHPPLVPDA